MTGDASSGGKPRAIVVMGVAGCGKTAVGEGLATRRGGVFIEGDRRHPPENVERMRRGEPLTDELRTGWLDAIGAAIAKETAGGRDVVAACSALKRIYRDRLRGHAPGLFFVHLDIDKATSFERVGQRPGHFMPASLVDSQFTALQPLEADEAGIALDGTMAVEELVELTEAGVRQIARG